MTFLEIIRNKMFWIIDAFHGKKVKRYYSLLNYIESNSHERSEIEEYQEKKLNELLNHARKTVSFYRNINSNYINDYPVINKNIIRDNYDSFLSTNYKKSDLIEMSTSGSTGTPFTCYQDINKKKHVNAETIYYNQQVGYKMGRRIIYFRSVVTEVSKTRLQQFMQNIFLVDCNELSDSAIEGYIKKIEKLTKHTSAMLMGYASTMDAFAKYFEKNHIEELPNCHIYGIVSGSEMLKDQTREILERTFSCKCVSRYANEENGFLGQDCDVNNEFFVNRADYYFEILKMDSDEKADRNELGRIVVTDFFNYAMPMIRYDTGDVGRLKSVQKGRFNRDVIASFGGRRVDQIYDSKGNCISPLAITNLMWSYKNISQYQFIQIDYGKYKMLVNVKNSTIDEEKLKADLRNIVKQNSFIEIIYVNEIPVLASRKRRYIVNQMEKV